METPFARASNETGVGKNGETFSTIIISETIEERREACSYNGRLQGSRSYRLRLVTISMTLSDPERP